MNARTVALALNLVLALHPAAFGQAPPSATRDSAATRLRTQVDSIFSSLQRHRPPRLRRRREPQRHAAPRARLRDG
jgi:hypothetical protein